MNQKKLLLMGLGTLLGFPLLGITIVGLIEEQPIDFYFAWNVTPWYFQLFFGIAIGIILGLIAWWWINRPALNHIKLKYGVLVYQFKLSTWQIFFISLCAGVGEEFLFRGVIQPYWGITVTAVFFVAIHGYLDPRDKHMLTYGILMTFLIGILGIMKQQLGLISAMAAHFAIDVVLFHHLTHDPYIAKESAKNDIISQELEQAMNHHEEEHM